MDFKLVEAKKMKTLEDYAIALVLGMISLQTLDSYHVRAVELGILKEDQDCRSNTIVWDLRRMIKLYRDQLESILELLPTDFDMERILNELKKHEITKAKQLTRRQKEIKLCVESR